MNKNGLILLVAALLLSFVSLFMNYTTSKKVDELQQQLGRESVKTSFSLNMITGGQLPFDSCFFDKDTAFFYKKGVFVGKSMTASSQQTEFFGSWRFGKK